MGRVYNFPQTLEKHLLKLKSSGGIIEVKPGKFAILHKEVEHLAYDYGVSVDVELKYCDLTKGCAVVKATAKYQGKSFTSLGEVSPLNNDFAYPVSTCEKRAADRAILKALNIHGDFYSDVELPPQKKNENEGIKLDHTAIIIQRIENASHQANLEQILRENKVYLTELSKRNSKELQRIIVASENKKQQLTGGK